MPHIDDENKSVCPQGFLKKLTYNLVKRYLIAPENYSKYILKEKYGKDDIIQSTLRRQLKSAPVVKEGMSPAPILPFIKRHPAEIPDC
uniref:Transposase n=1 Tax=Syphacia muris TaxID=451379 RepID=A0A0N5AWL3_9BILA